MNYRFTGTKVQCVVAGVRGDLHVCTHARCVFIQSLLFLLPPLNFPCLDIHHMSGVGNICLQENHDLLDKALLKTPEYAETSQRNTVVTSSWRGTRPGSHLVI